jgi:hypothetical protein
MTGVNWPAVLLGTVLAFGLGMIWFSPRMFGKIWSEGSHGIAPPAQMPVAAMVVQFIGTFLKLFIGFLFLVSCCKCITSALNQLN